MFFILVRMHWSPLYRTVQHSTSLLCHRFDMIFPIKIVDQMRNTRKTMSTYNEQRHPRSISQRQCSSLRQTLFLLLPRLHSLSISYTHTTQSTHIVIRSVNFNLFYKIINKSRVFFSVRFYSDRYYSFLPPFAANYLPMAVCKMGEIILESMHYRLTTFNAQKFSYLSIQE